MAGMVLVHFAVHNDITFAISMRYSLQNLLMLNINPALASIPHDADCASPMEAPATSESIQFQASLSEEPDAGACYIPDKVCRDISEHVIETTLQDIEVVKKEADMDLNESGASESSGTTSDPSICCTDRSPNPESQVPPKAVCESRCDSQTKEMTPEDPMPVVVQSKLVNFCRSLSVELPAALHGEQDNCAWSYTARGLERLQSRPHEESRETTPTSTCVIVLNGLHCTSTGGTEQVLSFDPLQRAFDQEHDPDKGTPCSVIACPKRNILCMAVDIDVTNQNAGQLLRMDELLFTVNVEETDEISRDNVTQVTEHLNSSIFPPCLCLSKRVTLFSHSNSTTSSSSEKTLIINSFMYLIIMLLTILFEVLPLLVSYINPAKLDSEFNIADIVKEFFAKRKAQKKAYLDWKPQLPALYQDRKPFKKLTSGDESSEKKKTGLWSKYTDSDILKDIIFRPWLPALSGTKKEPDKDKTLTQKYTQEDASSCRSFASKICSACQRRLEEFRSRIQRTPEGQQGKESHYENVQKTSAHPPIRKDTERLKSHQCHHQQRHHGDHLHHQQQFIIVNPAARYLPDPTCDPAIDLVHVGYRLATLSALSASMPISRIRLADAGFYFGGRGDEVTCYSCGRSHAGWERGDNPMEVHRRLHPDCEHVLQMDRLTQALNTNQNTENEVDGRGGPLSHTENRAAPVTAAAGSNPPAEDGEESGTRSRRRTDQRHQTPERNASQRTPPSPANTDRRPQTPQPTVSRPTGAASRNSPSAQETERTASSTATSTQRSATSNLPITQPSTNESVRNTSANQSQPTESNANRQTQSATSNVNPSPDANARAATTLHGQASGAESNPEARPLFPRPGLDLSGAVYPMYQDMQSRRRTFTTWNERNAPSLDQIILSGMFYAGYADCVRCFYCGVGLKHWVATDDVMTEHVRWRPGCEYLRTIKGDDFIRDVQQRLALQTSGSTGTNIGDSGNATPRATTTAAAATTNSSSPSPSSTSAATSAPVSSAATSASVRSATAAGASATTTTTTTSTSSLPSSSPTTATTTSNASSSSSSSSTNTLSAPSSTTSTSNNRPEASSATVTTTTSQATATTSSSSSARGDGATPSTTGHTSGSTSAVSSAAEDSETLDQLQAENRALEERFRCRVCHQGTINTILMPCGHLVACEDCARTVTSCPLCHDPIRATARVYLA